MANAIIDEDTCVTIVYRNIIKKPKHVPVCIKFFDNEIVRIVQGFSSSI